MKKLDGNRHELLGRHHSSSNFLHFRAPNLSRIRMYNNAIMEHVDTVGIVLIALSAIAWGASHILLVVLGSKIDLYSRIVGFLLFISVFIFSGWKMGVISIPIIFIVSCIGALIAKRIRIGIESFNNDTNS